MPVPCRVSLLAKLRPANLFQGQPSWQVGRADKGDRGAKRRAARGQQALPSSLPSPPEDIPQSCRSLEQYHRNNLEERLETDPHQHFLWPCSRRSGGGPRSYSYLYWVQPSCPILYTVHSRKLGTPEWGVYDRLLWKISCSIQVSLVP